MLNIILGPAGAGKSEKLIQDLVREAGNKPSGSFIAIVPEQSTLMMQRAVVAAHPAHAVMNIDIVSFERLAHKVLEEAGIPAASLLSDTDKILLLRRILDRCREDLMVYKNKVRMHGFAAEVKTVITELKQYAIDDNDLYQMQERARENGNQLLFAKLQDIRCIYQAFQAALEEKYQTQEDLLRVLASLAGSSGILQGAHLYLDGFTGFTPVQYKVIEAMLQSATDLTLTLTLPVHHPAYDTWGGEHFQLSVQTLERLRELAARAQIEVCTLEMKGTDHVPKAYVFQAADRREEIQFIAEEILQGVQKEGKRFRDYALVVSDMDRYNRILQEVFSKAGIPCFIDYKSELSNNPMARMLLCAMDLISKRFSYASVFAFLKCGLTDLSLDAICKLENYCLAFGIRGIKSWKEPFTRNRVLRKSQNTEDSEEYVWDLEEINQYREAVYEGLREFYYTSNGGAKTAEDYSRALLALFKRHRVADKMLVRAQDLAEQEDPVRSQEYEQIPELLTDLLEHIGMLLQGEPITVKEYTDVLSSAISDMRVRIIPPALDAVLAGDLTRTRLDAVDVLFLAGVNEGQLPAPPAEAGLFTRQERDFLKKEQFDLAPTILENLYTQYFYIYLMLAKPSETIYFTYAGADETGGELKPSYIIEEAGELLPGLTVQPKKAQSDVLWTFKGEQALADGIRRIMEGKDGPEEEAWLFPLLHYYWEQKKEVLEALLDSAGYQNRALPLDEQTIRDLYGEVLKGSVSRYETFYACPFRHFLNYGLQILERPEYDVKATDVGTIYHDSLERYGKRLKEEGFTFRDISDADSHRIAKECVQEAYETAESDALTSTERNAFLLKRMAEVTEKTTDVLRMQVRDGLYEPEEYEMAFQESFDGDLRFQGRIDRVDLYDAGDLYVKIIDYKSGAKRFSIRDIYTGKQLQLTAYLKAAVKEMQRRHPGKVVKPGGVYYYLIQDHFVRSEKEAQERFRMSGLTSCEPEALQAIDTQVKPGEASRIVEISYGKNGLHARSHVANEGEFQHLMDFTEQKIRTAGERIRQGDVAIAPEYESGSQNACTYCEYREVCKFEPGKWGSDYVKLSDGITTEEMEKEIYGRDKVDKSAAGSNPG